MQAIGNKIITKKVTPKDNKTESGIILGNKPSNDNDYEVVSIGGRVEGVSINDVVRVFKNSPGEPIVHNEEKYFVFTTEQIEFIL